jgi:serine/threonine protein kinase
MKISYQPYDSDVVRAEVQGLARAISLESIGFVNIYQIAEQFGRLSVLMELADCTLFDSIRREQGRGDVRLKKLLGYIQLVAHSVDKLKENGCIHGALTPQKMLVFGHELRLCGFSLLHRTTEPFPRRNVSLLTWSCMSPEMRSRKPSLYSDQYSICASYVMMRNPGVPFLDQAFERIDLSFLGSQERQVVAEALSSDPLKRFKSCADFALCL